jgi:hypothetical protein
MLRILCALSVLAVSVSPALGVTFTEDFEDPWFDNGWALETGLPTSTIEIKDPLYAGSFESETYDTFYFPLNNGQNAGGLIYRADPGGSADWKEPIFLTKTFNVAPGTYTFNVSVDTFLFRIEEGDALPPDERPDDYSTDLSNDWDHGMSLYMGNATDMEITGWNGTDPTGWEGFFRTGEGDYQDQLLGVQWNRWRFDGSKEDNDAHNFAEPRSDVFTQTYNGTTEITVDSNGELVFRMGATLKAFSVDTRWGIDNLQIELVPEPATLSLLGIGLLPLLRRRR